MTLSENTVVNYNYSDEINPIPEILKVTSLLDDDLQDFIGSKDRVYYYTEDSEEPH